MIYPESGDNCLFCHQPLTQEAETLINSYWALIKSVAEENAKIAKGILETYIQKYQKLKFDLFPEENTLAFWLTKNHPKQLDILKQRLNEKKTVTKQIISDIENKKIISRIALENCSEEYKTLLTKIENAISLLKKDEHSKELDRLLKAKIKLEHKEKFNTHFIKFGVYVSNQAWIDKANKANFAKHQITATEKTISKKYFNKKYIDTFNNECEKLNGKFGIEISHTGSAGKSYRQLKLKGKKPNTVLSEGEQRVIAIADFIAEMKLSEINKGIIFDDPVNSLDEIRKSKIAFRLVQESISKQVIIFTHDLVFVHSLICHCKEMNVDSDCHWIENINGGQPGTIWLRNTPSFEKDYKTSGKAQNYYDEAKKLSPEHREDKIKNGFAALRTSYETQVVFGLFNGVVQRFVERVSVDSLSGVAFTCDIRDEILDGFYKCCRYMEGHSHSDKYAYKKPQLDNLLEEIQRFNSIKKKISDLSKAQKKPSS